MMMLFGMVGLGSIVASAALPLLAWVGVRNGWLDTAALGPLLGFGVACALLVVWTHRANLARMRAGTEPRAKRLWLLGRLRGRT
jgi:glycerol-3-phosphate acyltransferase PlsY